MEEYFFLSVTVTLTTEDILFAVKKKQQYFADHIREIGIFSTAHLDGHLLVKTLSEFNVSFSLDYFSVLGGRMLGPVI